MISIKYINKSHIHIFMFSPYFIFMLLFSLYFSSVFVLSGYGMLGQAGSGKLRVSAGQSKLAAKVAKK